MDSNDQRDTAEEAANRAHVREEQLDSLHTRGRPLPERARTIAVVGARGCTAYGQTVAVDLAAGLAEAGLAVVTTGDYGIAAAALRGCTAADGHAVVVLPTGLDAPAHAPANRRLLEHLGAGAGTLVSAYDGDELASSAHVLERNAVLVQLCAAVVLVEGERGRSAYGQLVAAARLFGVPVLAVPGPVTSSLSGLCHDLIRDGRATLVTSSADVLHSVGATV